MHFFVHWLAHFFGLDSGSGAFYLAWSGFASDVTELVIFIALWRALNCHTKGCWRIGLHKVGDSPYRVCRKCHPRIGKPTAAEIAAIPPPK